MGSIKDELNAYLLKNGSAQDNSFKRTFSMPQIGPWFKKSEVIEDTEGWFASYRKNDFCPTLSRIQRLIGFFICIFIGGFCFFTALMLLPVLLLKARKFALLYSLGSLFFLVSFSFLWGPMTHLKSLCSRDRLPFTVAYVGTLFATLYSALWLQSVPITVLAAVLQFIALLWFLFTSIPGGQTGLSFMTRLFSSAITRSVSRTLPV